MDSLVDVNKQEHCITIHYFHTFFSRHLPWMSFFVSCIFTLRFFPAKVFLVSSRSKILDIFLQPPPPPHTHTYGQFGALSQAPTQPPQTICLICFVFSNELDVKFNIHTHSYAKEKNCAELFLFEFFDSQSRKLLKRVKVSQKKKYCFHNNRERRRWSSVVVWRSKKHLQITPKHTQTQTYPSTHIRVLSKV